MLMTRRPRPLTVPGGMGQMAMKKRSIAYYLRRETLRDRINKKRVRRDAAASATTEAEPAAPSNETVWSSLLERVRRQMERGS